VDFVRHWVERAELTKKKLISLIGISPGKYYGWGRRYGTVRVKGSDPIVFGTFFAKPKHSEGKGVSEGK
jgi:hypothetical protein